MEVRAQKHKSRLGGLSLKNRVLCSWTTFKCQDYLFPIVVTFSFPILYLCKKKCYKLIDPSYVNRLNKHTDDL